MNNITVMTIVGTRPQLIKLSQIINKLDAVCTHILVHTGQNYDYQLNEIFFTDLGLRTPDVFLQCNVTSLGASVGDIIIKSQKLFNTYKPSAVLVLGDTNSCLAVYMAKRMHIPIYHMQAGNRCFDNNVPEQINRKIVDHISDINLVYTEHARRNLLDEGLHSRTIYLTGSPMREVINRHLADILSSDVVTRIGLVRNQYFLVSIHREQNVDNLNNLKQIVRSLYLVRDRYGVPIIVSTHPRMKKALQKLEVVEADGITFAPPFGFIEYCNLQINAKCVISDSGTISEQTSILGFNAVTLRNAIERVQAIDTGSIILTGVDSQNVVRMVQYVLANKQQKICPPEYQIPNTTERVVNLILGTHNLINLWEGII